MSFAPIYNKQGGSLFSSPMFYRGKQLGNKAFGRSVPSLLSQATAYWLASDYDSGTDSLTEQTGNGVGDAQLGSTSGADTNDPLRLGYGNPTDYGYDHVYLDGVAGSYLSHPDFAAFPTGDIDIRVKVALDDWTPNTSTFFGKWHISSSKRCALLQIRNTNNLAFFWSPDGTAATQINSTVVVSITDGSIKWIRVTFDADNGSSGNDVKFYTSDDGSSWSQLGSTITTAGIASLFDSNKVVEIGAANAGTTDLAKGKFYEAIVYSDLTETTKVLHWKATDMQYNGGLDSTTGSQWSIYGNWLKYGSDSDYVYLPGTAGNYASLPDFAAFPTGDITIDVKVALDDWTPAANVILCAKWTTTGNQGSVSLYLLAGGTLRFYITPDGTSTNQKFVDSSVTTGISDSNTYWIRCTFDSSTQDVKFFKSNDDVSFSQLGTTKTIGGTSIFNSTSPVYLGAFQGTLNLAKGKFYEARVYSDITQTTKVLHWKATSMTQSGGADDAPTSAGTWTINRTSTGAFSQLVTRPVLQLQTDDYLRVLDHADLNFDGDFTLCFYGRQHVNASVQERMFYKTGIKFYTLYRKATTSAHGMFTSDGIDTSASLTLGVVHLTAGGYDGSNIFIDVDGVRQSAVIIPTDLSNTGDLYIGSQAGAVRPINSEFTACVVFKGTALTTAQLTTLTTELDTALAGRTGD